ncbi:uncharacterized protein LOC111677594 isoform X2 [Lucilia cuprina]|uniref:uncharacterized protein LOC111677594 isoform X2 n=1 Tax=Lucilia cuprina TaxID=7375 RepID=UPI001F06CA98|nr:uncharacterized protein LOC111677594 isoform X2 [Lucilia cuprina]
MESSETDESTVADHDLYLLLQDWNLKHFYNHFIDHHITIKVLKILKPKHIDMLFYGLPIGDMVTFEDEFEKWKKTHIDESTNLEKPRCFNQQQFVSVNTILQDTENGKQILKYYEKNKILHEGHRNLLIDTISKYIEAKGYKLSISQCADLEKEICKIFPSEELEYYNTGKRGKLYNKIFNLKRLSKGIFKSEEESDTNLRDELVPEKDSSFAIQILRSGHYSNDEMDLYWRKCYQCRFKQIKESKSTSEILKLWPEYIKPSGYTLIDIDFGLKYPQAKDMKTKIEDIFYSILPTLFVSTSAESSYRQSRSQNQKKVYRNRFPRFVCHSCRNQRGTGYEIKTP